MKVHSRFFEIQAQLDIFIDLARKYIAFISFGMIGIMFFVDMGFGLVLNIVIAIGILLSVCVIVWIDWKYVFPKKVKKLSMNNPITVEILERLGKIEELN
jgi:hypothetical protein